MKVNFDNPSEEVQIQIVPLIDVIFCILTFFILAALQLTRQQGINLDLPKAGTANVQMREMLVVTIDSTGQTYVDKQLTDRAQLFQAVKTYHDQNPEGLLVLRASQTAFYNDVIQVLDIMREVGGNQVALATDPAPAPTGSSAVPEQVSPQLPITPGLQSPTLTPNLPVTPGLPDSSTPANPSDLQQIPGTPGGSSTIPNQTSPAPTGEASPAPDVPQ